jgi:hypothetical protein
LQEGQFSRFVSYSQTDVLNQKDTERKTAVVGVLAMAFFFTCPKISTAAMV